VTAARFLAVVATTFEGATDYHDADGTLVAERDAAGAVTDWREPPFLAMSPCPYCDATEDRGHVALRHVDPRLGVRTR
jgi:hypothetical protein